MSKAPRRTWLFFFALIFPTVLPNVVRAYDFDVRSVTAGQGYRTRWFRPGADGVLNRRRFVQSLELSVWNLLDPPAVPGFSFPKDVAPFQLSFVTSMRLHHDFGDYLGPVIVPVAVGHSMNVPSSEVVPELREESLQLDVQNAYLEARNVWDMFDLRLGRQVRSDAGDWIAFDGLYARAVTPWRFDVSAFTGLALRNDYVSGVASSRYELDGTSFRCTTYDKASELWIVTDDCPQRSRMQPTFGASIATQPNALWHGELSYRKTMSRAATQLLPPNVDVPRWGTNAEVLSAVFLGTFGRGHVNPWFAGRYSLVVRDAELLSGGVELANRRHRVGPEIARSHPVFDSDSIFNVFSTQPFWDFRLTYRYVVSRGIEWNARGWRRWFQADESELMPSAGELPNSHADGLSLGMNWSSNICSLRLLSVAESGAGGERVGGDVWGSLRIARGWKAEGRVSAGRFDSDLRIQTSGFSFGSQFGLRWQLQSNIVLHFLAEENINSITEEQFRGMVVADLFFEPQI